MEFEMRIYKPEPNPFKTILLWKEELIKRYKKSSCYKKPLWWIIFFLVIFLILLEIFIIPNIK